MSQLLDTEVSAIQWCPLFRGVRYSEVFAIQRCPLFRGVRYSEVFAIQRCSLFRGVRYSEVSAIQRCPLFRGVHYNSCRSKKMFPLFGGARYYHRYWGLILYTPPDFCCWNHLHLFEVFPYVYLFRLIHDIQSLFVMLNNLSYIHHFVGIFEKNQQSFHDDNNNELLDAIIFFWIQFKVNVFVYIFHNLETSSNKLPIVNSKLI